VPVPDFQTIMLPALRFAASHGEHTLRQATDHLADEFHLTEEDRNQLLPSGRQPTFYNRVSWARGYLKQAGLLQPTRHNHLTISKRGTDVLSKNPSKIDMKFLGQFPEYVAFRERARAAKHDQVEAEEESALTPEESLEAAYRRAREELAADLLDHVRRSPPSFFEQLVVELLSQMGYGGSRAEAARAVGKSGDEGIDGIIDEDRLGLDSIYIQAKRWSDNPVSRKDIQQFVGALQGKRARKGVFITTSRFTDEATAYASTIDVKVVLIDGTRLAQLMIDHNVGVSTVAQYELKKLDSDYFYEITE
jgi:restriction system protein